MYRRVRLGSSTRSEPRSIFCIERLACLSSPGPIADLPHERPSGSRDAPRLRRISPPPPPRNPIQTGEAVGLIVEPAGAISLGTVPPGGTTTGRLTLKNKTDIAIVIDRIEASCPCIRVASIPARVEGRSARTLAVMFDPRAEPEFRGGLAVELTGYGPDRAIIFRGRVDLDVSSGLSGTEVREPSR